MLYIIFLTSAYYNTLVNFATVICFNYGKDSYFTLSCPELKVIGNIKKIEGKKILRKNSPLKYFINYKEINLSQLIGGKHFTVLYIVF